MAVRFDFESVEGVAVGIAHGPLTLDEIKESAATMWRLIEGPRIRLLWDLREASFDLGTAEVRDLAEVVKQLAPATEFRSAFVVSGDLEFGLVRMFEVYRQTKGTLTRVFRDKQQALDWLTNDSP
jgi:hypothetical protein